MQIEARFRRRVAANESIAELNSELLNNLLEIRSLWAEDKSVEDFYFDPGTNESAAADLSPCLASGIKGAISYASRLIAAVQDKAISDDSLILKFDSDEIDYQRFSSEIFPEIVKVFSPYRATIIIDLDQDLDDFEDIVEESQKTGKDVDGRDTVYRFNPVNYFDDLMCMRAFGVNSDEVIEKLSDSIEKAEKISAGVLLVVTSKLVKSDDLVALDGAVRKHL